MRIDIYYRPAIPLVMVYICGIALGDLWPGFALPTLAVAGTAAIGVIFRLVRRKTALYSPLLLLAALGYLAIQPWVVPRLPAHHISHFARPAHWIITGEVSTDPYPYHRGLRFDLNTHTLRATTGESEPKTVCGRLRVTLSSDLPGLGAGDTVQFRARINATRNFNNPGGFDFRRYMGFKKIRNTCWVSERQTENLRILSRPETRLDLAQTRGL